MVRLLIVADIRLYREGLAEILGHDHRFEVVGTASDRTGCLEKARACMPTVMLIDLGIPESLEIVRETANLNPHMGIVGLAVPEVEFEIMAYAAAGVSGYVMREESLADLVRVLVETAKGKPLLPQPVQRSLLRGARRQPEWTSYRRILGNLTRRELEVGGLVCSGLSNKAIAQRLYISEFTVKNHVHNMFQKLNVGSRVEAAARLRSLGVVRAVRLSR